MEGKPPVDVYEDLIIEDPDNFNYGFIAEGVLENQGLWHKIGTAPNGDFLWIWLLNNESKDSLKSKKERGWAIRGNKPIFINTYWVVMGFNPAILYFSAGEIEKTEGTRIEVEESELKVNKTIVIPAKHVELKNILKVAEIKEPNLNTQEEEKKEKPIDSNIMNLYLSVPEKPETQIKFFFPLIELTDALFADVSNLEAMSKFIRRINFFISNPISEFNIFTFKDGQLNFIYGKQPLDEQINKIKQVITIEDEAISTENSLLFKKALKEQTIAIMLWFNGSLSLNDANDILKHLKNAEYFMNNLL